MGLGKRRYILLAICPCRPHVEGKYVKMKDEVRSTKEDGEREEKWRLVMMNDFLVYRMIGLIADRWEENMRWDIVCGCNQFRAEMRCPGRISFYVFRSNKDSAITRLDENV